MHKHPLAKVLAALVATAIAVVALAPAAIAASPPSRVEGTPTITSSSPTGYYIWHNDDGFHLRTHGPGAQHDFDAVLSTKGTFENVSAVKLENGDRLDVTDGGHKLVIHFHTFDFTDGVNFTVRDGERLRLNLRLDDKPAATSEIFLGPKGKHPKHNPFKIKL